MLYRFKLVDFFIKYSNDIRVILVCLGRVIIKRNFINKKCYINIELDYLFFNFIM